MTTTSSNTSHRTNVELTVTLSTSTDIHYSKPMICINEFNPHNDTIRNRLLLRMRKQGSERYATHLRSHNCRVGARIWPNPRDLAPNSLLLDTLLCTVIWCAASFDAFWIRQLPPFHFLFNCWRGMCSPERQREKVSPTGHGHTAILFLYFLILVRILSTYAHGPSVFFKSPRPRFWWQSAMWVSSTEGLTTTGPSLTTVTQGIMRCTEQRLSQSSQSQLLNKWGV